MAEIIDGKKIAEEIKLQVRREIIEHKLEPGLAIILVGNNPASELYVRLKKEACEKVGITFNLYKFAEDAKEKDILETIHFLNHDSEIHGILIQLPLPAQLNTDFIIRHLDPAKDVDGFHPLRLEDYNNNPQAIAPGLIEGLGILAASTKVELSGKNCCILANSDEFATTAELYFQRLGMITSHVHPTDPAWSEQTKQADLLIVAVGRPLFIMAEHIKDETIIIDVGTNKIGSTTVGDVNYTDVFPKCSYITPVPGGVGPMTIALLLQNCCRLALQK